MSLVAMRRRLLLSQTFPSSTAPIPRTATQHSSVSRNISDVCDLFVPLPQAWFLVTSRRLSEQGRHFLKSDVTHWFRHQHVINPREESAVVGGYWLFVLARVCIPLWRTEFAMKLALRLCSHLRDARMNFVTSVMALHAIFLGHDVTRFRTECWVRCLACGMLHLISKRHSRESHFISRI